MRYQFGLRSRQRLSGVNPDLVAVMKKAISISKQDFSIIEGIRSEVTQRKYFKSGVTTTMKSRHLTGHAVDVVYYPAPKTSDWDFEPFCDIADAVRQAAKDCDVKIRWGAAWHIADIREWEGTMQEAVDEYVELRRSKNRKPFVDGPHFEIPRK